MHSEFHQTDRYDPKYTTTSVINFQWNAQNSDFGHVRTYSSLHKLRNTQGKIHGT